MSRALSVCSTPGCYELVKRGKCDQCRSKTRRQSDRNRPNAGERGYDAKWRRTTARYLKYHRICECDNCSSRPEHERPKADTVHHRDDLGPLGPNGHKWFNLRAMYAPHHSQHTTHAQPGGWNA